MAKGYAIVLTQGVSVHDYLMRCGIAEGAQLMRSQPKGAPMPDGAPADPSMTEALAALADAEKMTDAEADAGCESQYLADLAEWELRKDGRALLRLVYESALQQVRALQNPGPNFSQEFEAFKADRIAELEQSIATDCDDRRDRQPVRLSPNEWRVQQIMAKQHMVEYLQQKAVGFMFVGVVRASLSANAPI